MTQAALLPTAWQSWQNFYILTGTAAATLTGLMFVSITFGASLVNRESATMARAFIDPTFTHFVQVLFTACLLTIPVLGPMMLGVLLLIAAAGRLVALVWVYRQFKRAQEKHSDIDLSDWLTAIVFPLIVHLITAATGVAFVLDSPMAFAGLAVSTLALLAIGVVSAWELVLWMAVTVNERRGLKEADAPPKDRAAGT